MSWVASACVGFVRSCIVLVVSMLVPAVWAAGVAVAIWWRSPWTWIVPFVWAALGTLLLIRPVAGMVRSLLARWTGTVIPGGYRELGTVTRLSTGFWWNGHSYEKTRRDAEKDLRLRVRWTDPANWRDLRCLAILAVTAGLSAAVPPAGIVAAVLGFAQSMPVLGVAGLVVAVASSPYAWRPFEPIAVRFLRPTPSMALANRVDELTAQRADATVAQAAEIRRIERDLHDGAQARLVSLGLSLATAEKLMETDPRAAKALLKDARVGAATSLSELRELVRGINPPVLNERGLVDAVRALAMDTPLETTVSAGGQLRLDPPIESALYFGIAELLTNAVKHAQADHAEIAISHDGNGIVVLIEDDGRGDARVEDAGGLAGLRRRLAAFDGTLELTSPDGGPTRARITVPCESL
ncbi:sensor histidine kinase [Kribbella capetownensis]|uniref:histidine kinase n=1 Tax=Kribbella capetownensis TaxID=1572659 RepID=A0A4R0JHN5_9ACTN|nr:histidine kinase [Kribbella capetownensis]TCC46533.1 sensor histidine kinase [Kribbella capetownensis]